MNTIRRGARRAIVVSLCLLGLASCGTSPVHSRRRATKSSRVRVTRVESSDPGFWGRIFGKKKHYERLDLDDLPPYWVFMLADHMEEMSSQVDLLLPVASAGEVRIKSRYKEYNGKRLFTMTASRPILIQITGPAHVVGLVLPDAPNGKTGAKRRIGVFEKNVCLKQFEIPVLPEAKEKTSYVGHKHTRAGKAIPIFFDVNEGIHLLELRILDKQPAPVRAFLVKPVYYEDED